jgi:hypothetical protein
MEITADDAYISSLQSQVQDLTGKNIQLNSALSSYSNTRDDQNSIQYQLETADVLNKIEHFLRGEHVVYNDEQGEHWETPTDTNLILFNDYGVNSIMIIVGSYIDKGTILSNYSEERIYEILADIGDELIKFIFCNYDSMGMNTNFKKTRYELTVLNILHTIESAYRRAIRGKSFEDINKTTIYTQIEGAKNINPTTAPKKFSLIKPSTWH